jgi:hypothetical protein
MEKAFLICFFLMFTREVVHALRTLETQKHSRHTHTQPRSHCTCDRAASPVQWVATAGCVLAAGGARFSLEGLLVFVEEGVPVLLELERELRPAAAHLQRFTVAGIGTSRGRQALRAPPPQPAFGSRAARALLSGPAGAGLSKRVGFWRGAGWAARADCEPVRCGRASARWPRGCGLDCNMC